MKILLILPVVWLLIVLNADHAESRRWFRAPYKMFVFGDSFADTGNAPKSELNQDSRQWYPPYGNDDSRGRFSNRWIQTDFIAKILGRYRESPPIYRLRGEGYLGALGMNFAVSGAGVYEVPQKVPNLSEQVDQFEMMIKEGIIRKWSVRRSVALVAISGRDYALISPNETAALVENVTTEIAKEVKRLQDLGVPKILVNNLHPLGCAPWQARPSNYTRCDDRANAVASIHNKNLTEKLGTDHDSVMILDLNTAFSRIIQLDPAKARSADEAALAGTFKNRLRPTCESLDPKGYCGQKDEDGRPKYTVADLDEDVFGYFYWDDVHPTHTGWSLVMTLLEGAIKKFLHI